MAQIKIEQLENKNQFVIKDFKNRIIYLQSYNSIIAEVKHNELNLSNHWNYSKTTLKHLYLFLYHYYFAIWHDLQTQPNKKAYIQKLIENGTIKNTLES